MSNNELLKELEEKFKIMQRDDLVWSALLNDPKKEGALYKYFEKAYTSPNILIFKRNDKIKAK